MSGASSVKEHKQKEGAKSTHIHPQTVAEPTAREKGRSTATATEGAPREREKGRQRKARCHRRRETPKGHGRGRWEGSTREKWRKVLSVQPVELLRLPLSPTEHFREQQQQQRLMPCGKDRLRTTAFATSAPPSSNSLSQSTRETLKSRRLNSIGKLYLSLLLLVHHHHLLLLHHHLHHILLLLPHRYQERRVSEKGLRSLLEPRKPRGKRRREGRTRS